MKFFCCNLRLPYIFLESTNIIHECDVIGFLVTWDYKTEMPFPDYVDSSHLYRKYLFYATFAATAAATYFFINLDTS